MIHTTLTDHQEECGSTKTFTTWGGQVVCQGCRQVIDPVVTLPNRLGTGPVKGGER